MNYTLVLTKASTAKVEQVAPSEAMAAARAAWDGGAWSGVRLLTPDNTLFWKRGGSTDTEAERRERAALARAAGLSRLSLDCAEICGLADLAAPLSPIANSVEVRSGDPTVDGLLRVAAGPPRLRDLLTFVDERLTSSATLSAWRITPGPWPNPAHRRAEVTLSSTDARADHAAVGPSA